MKKNKKDARSGLVLLVVYLLLVIIIGRLFYWQVLKGSDLRAAASEQYQQSVVTTAQRGSISTSDGYLLVGNKPVYRLYAQPHLITADPYQIARDITQALLEHEQIVTNDEELETTKQNLITSIQTQLESSKKWLTIRQKISPATMEAIVSREYTGIGVEPYQTRSYPEASTSAHIVGFVGKNSQGNDQGYFGIEGGLDQELKGRSGLVTRLTDATGLQLSDSVSFGQGELQGRDVILTIRRDVQLMIEDELKKAVQKYGAQSGEVVVMEPSTGKILGLASWPNYSPEHFYEFDPNQYKNPSLTQLYEPGSTFKVLTVAAGIDSKKITPDTICPICDGPYKADKYTIKTWNEVYNPDISMKDGLAKSDNIAMIYIANQVGTEKLRTYLQDFGIGEELYLDLQEDSATPFPEKWGPVELATRSFGQGILTNSLQLTRAIATIANHGVMMKPLIVEEVVDPYSNRQIQVEPSQMRQVISAQSAATVTQMMVHAANHGEAQWTATDEYQVAGKTGTSQVASEDGGYEEERTIASFVGFAPAENPKFVLLVKLDTPTYSPWASETATPAWYQISDKLMLLL